NTLNLFHNQNAGDPNAWTYVPDLSKPAYSDRTWENYTPRITWQATERNKFSFVWDEQPICRKCTGATSFSGSPSPTTSPDRVGLVCDRFTQHEVRLSGLLVEGRPPDVRQQPEPAVHVHWRRALLHSGVHQRLQRQRARHGRVVLRAGPMDGPSPDAAGGAP